ncbi:MAG: SH3 domain-containing protein [Clostridia bacterium]|nr:SH3 domain-containing protein [Clostridia bacterium]
MKKILAMVLAMLMAISCVFAVFAEDEQTEAAAVEIVAQQAAEEIAAEPIELPAPAEEAPAAEPASAEEAAQVVVDVQPEVVEAEPEAVDAEPEAVETEPAATEPETTEAEPEAVESEPEVIEAESEPEALESEIVTEEPTAEAEQPVAEEPAAEEPEVVESEAAETETESVEPEATEPVAEEPVEAEPVAEEPAAEEPEAVEVEPEVVESEAAEAEPEAAEPVAEEPVEVEPAVEEPTEAETEVAPVAFEANFSAYLVNREQIVVGDAVYLFAVVTDANMAYTLTWETLRYVVPEGEEAALPTWQPLVVADNYSFFATMADNGSVYRAVLTAEDGTVIISGEITVTVVEPAEPAETDAPAEDTIEETTEPTEEPAEEIAEPTEEPAEEIAEPVEEPAEEITEPTEEPAEETAEPTEEPVEEITEPTEEPAEEIVEPTEEPAEEIAEPVEEPAEEIAEPVEEPAEEITEPIDEPAEEPKVVEPSFTDLIIEATNSVEPEAQADEVIEIENYETPLGYDPLLTITLEGNEDEVNVREDADGLSAIFTSLPEGTQVTVLAIEGDWVTVIIDDQIGYIYIDDIAAYFTPDEEEKTDTEPANADEDPQTITQPEKKVTIFTSRRTVMEVGETVYLTSKLEGFEDCNEIMYVWKVDKGDGFEVVAGANEDTYTFSADAESLTWGWQLTVYYR